MAEQVSNKELYALLLSLKDEVKQLALHIRALRKEMKGETGSVNKK